MRIVIDMQGAQTESRYRGIGRYTMEFAKAVAQHRGSHEVFLALSGQFPESIDLILESFQGILPAENILTWHVPGPINVADPANITRREVAERIREAFFASLRADIVHITSLFEGFKDDALASYGRFPSQAKNSVTLYDLIPLIESRLYLDGDLAYKQHYLHQLNWLKNADCLLAISESSKREGELFLNLNPDTVTNIAAAVDASFRPLSVDEQERADLLGRLGVSKPFVLYTGGTDERKNLKRLIQAWSELPADIQADHQLLFAGKISELDLFELKQAGIDAGLEPWQLCFSGYVTDEDLIKLYNLCKLFVFPSWHEGFGLPALEAMACGSPVIGSNTTSVPEVIGLDEAMFDPRDVGSIRDKLSIALTDDDFLRRLRDHGQVQVKQFSWAATALRAIEAWESCVDQRSKSSMSWRQIHTDHQAIYYQLLSQIAAQVKTGVNDIDLQRISIAIARNEAISLPIVRRKALAARQSWRIEGPYDSSYSLALVNREVARALQALSHDVALHSTEGPGDFLPNPDFLATNPDLAQMSERSRILTALDADVVSRNLYPPRVADMVGRHNYLHAYGWEESGFPFEWICDFNVSLQGMTVMSNHVRKILIDNGLSVPVEVSSLGVDHWERIEPDTNYLLQTNKSFRFLHVSSCFPRKGADVMLRAYGKAFRAQDDVVLVIKTFKNPHNHIHLWLQQVRQDNPDFPDVQIIEEDLTDPQIKSLYGHCHALVAPSRAEGFGLPMAEAMLSGLVVITTGWSGQVDFCTRDTAWLIDFSFAHAKSHFGLFSSVWAEPNEQHLTQIMRQVYETPEHARKLRSEAGRKLLLERFTWAHAANRMVQSAAAWSDSIKRTEPNIGWVTTWNTKCGIATYSEHLIRQMPGTVHVLSPHSDSLQGPDGNQCSRCWNQDGIDALENLADVIGQKNINILVIQFNYGFFNFEHFARFIQLQIDAGRKIVLVLHATTDPDHVPEKKLSYLVPVLVRCHRLLVHSIQDLNRLKSYGLVDNVTLFPHGILDHDTGLQSDFSRGGVFTIATFGFFLPHKGLIETIRAMPLLREKGLDARLLMLNAEYPVMESHVLVKQAQKEISQLGLEPTVELCTEFMSDEDILGRLTGADLVVFPYQETGESASGAVRYGIASGRPIATSPQAIFDDIASLAFRLPGDAPQEIAQGIYEVANHIRRQSGEAREKTLAAERWRSEHRYSRLAERLHGMCRSLLQ